MIQVSLHIHIPSYFILNLKVKEIEKSKTLVLSLCFLSIFYVKVTSLFKLNPLNKGYFPSNLLKENLTQTYTPNTDKMLHTQNG